MNVVKITTVTGEVQDYIPFAERLPLFLADYPPKDGWGVRLKSRQPYESDPTFWMFRASLVSPEGKVVAQASSLRRVVVFKDYEIGETASVQRLISMLGYPGDPDIFNQEALDLAQQGSDMTANDESESDSPVPSISTAQVESVPANTPKASALAAQADDIDASTHIPRGIVRRIEVLAKRKGVEVPPYATVAEAREAMAELQR
jgi:hypothetical protein